MRRTGNIGRAFKYLTERAKDGVCFSQEELAEAAEWTLGNTQTNLTKRLSELVRREGKGLYAQPEILRVNFRDFSDLFRQKQRLFTDYKLEITSSVLVYEFFMPLAREDRLRETLDNLFYVDTINQRIHEIGYERIRKDLKLSDNSTEEEIAKLVREFIENTIGGYSLYLVSGRYRADSLKTRTEAVQRTFSSGPYLIDETTAVVRFILPVETKDIVLTQNNLFEPASSTNDTEEQTKQNRAEQMRWLFLNFFAEAVTRVVKNEDEIWLLENGMRSALYRWVRRDE